VLVRSVVFVTRNGGAREDDRSVIEPSTRYVRPAPMLRALLVTLLGVATSAFAQSGWEMRVCAAPHAFPSSAQHVPGYDNRIAEILADELDAELTFEWISLDTQKVALSLNAGDCDMALGISDGAAGLLSSVPYYRTPFVFVYRSDSPFEIRSLDDEVLRELTVASYPNGLPWRGLLNRGFTDNLASPDPISRPGGPDYAGPIVRGVVDGTIDVGILYGPDAVDHASLYGDDLVMVPVSPEIDPPLSQMFRIWTVAFRPGDSALRDRINIALAARWDDIQAVFAAYRIPLQSTPRPRLPRAVDPVRVGVVLPLASGPDRITDVVANAARVGALLAEDLVLRSLDNAPDFEVEIASSPDVEAAVRAAERLIVTEDVSVLIGGFGDGQAQALAEVAAERGVLFFNIGSPDLSLRVTCLPGSYHVEASASMYLDAIVAQQGVVSGDRWFVVYEEGIEGELRAERAVAALEAAGVAGVELASVVRNQFVYNDEIDRIAELSPDAVLLLMSAEDVELFLSQVGRVDEGVVFLPFPEPVAQTRASFTRLRQVALDALEPSVALWETTLEPDGAADLNQSFVSRAGEPMDPAGWAAYAAVTIVVDAVINGDADSAATISAYLDRPDTTFDLTKGAPLSFRSWDRQLRQPLYLVEIDPEAPWGIQVSSRVAIASLLGRLPTPFDDGIPTPDVLDRLGDGPTRLGCFAD
jgi:ABC-type branched-subunit amino acid transport system substrate-binding protein